MSALSPLDLGAFFLFMASLTYVVGMIVMLMSRAQRH